MPVMNEIMHETKMVKRRPPSLFRGALDCNGTRGVSLVRVGLVPRGVTNPASYDRAAEVWRTIDEALHPLALDIEFAEVEDLALDVSSVVFLARLSHSAYLSSVDRRLIHAWKVLLLE